MITKNEREKIEKYLASLDGIDVAYLFGSQSNGKSNLLSDIDIAVLFKDKFSLEERFDRKLKIMGDLGILLKTNNIDVVDLKSADVALQFSAIENRDLLLVKNDLARSLFEAETMTKYQDYKYYISLNTKDSLDSFSRIAI
ncbi:MAG: hypothetical protein ACD_19C00015G0009 [uncultured bacterium]|nr:MAG: hypothetical protein ACD_19C00015G0009 [uncultured bacterium]